MVAQNKNSKKSVRQSNVVEEQSVSVPEPTPVVEEPVVEEPVVDEKTNELDTRLSQIKVLLSDTIKEYTARLRELRELESEIRKLPGIIKKEIKNSSKKKKVSKTVDGTTKNFGFNAVCPISSELADFLKLDRGSSITRPQATKLICAYAEQNKLKNPENKSTFLNDPRFEKLFGPAIYPLNPKKNKLNVSGKVMGYDIFNLQKYLKPHFIKA